MSRPVDYCTVEFDFLTGGANRTFMSLTAAQRFAYICVWSYAVHLRKSYLTNYEIEHRLGAIYDIDRRTVAKMLQACSKDARLLTKKNDGYDVAGVMIKHGKLRGFAPAKAPAKMEVPVDSIGEDSIGEDSNKKDTPTPTPKKIKRFKPPAEEEVAAYVSEKGYSIDPVKFVAFYESKGWMVGKNKMKDWKSAVRGWAARDKKSNREHERTIFDFPEGEEVNHD